MSVAVRVARRALLRGHRHADAPVVRPRPRDCDLGFFFYVWVFIMITASSNAVNLTDGLDGLASGSSTLVLSAFVVIAFWQFRHACEPRPRARRCYAVDADTALDLAIVAAAAMGAVAGFLWWNAAPARIFMGDTGSLAHRRAARRRSPIMTDTQLLLLILGGLFVAGDHCR